MSDLEPHAMLNEITALSREFGTPDFVKGGGGNTSCKSGDTLWVKPSGTTLSALRPETFVAMDRARLRRLFDLAIPAEKQAREALVKDVMAAAVLPGQNARPSVEAPLHETLSTRYVVHTHAVLVNGLTCGRDGEAACRRLFPEALWVPYIDPGYTLCVDVHRRLRAYRQDRGREPRVLILENHGIFVSGDTPEEIRAHYRSVLDPLVRHYADAGVATALAHGALAPAEAVRALGAQLQQWLGPDAQTIVTAPPCSVAAGPLSPDHIVYSKAFPHTGSLSAESLADFRRRHGYAPRVISTPGALFAAGHTAKVAQLALDLALDGARVQQLTHAFGGPRYLDDAARTFIETWEVESYRAKQMQY